MWQWVFIAVGCGGRVVVEHAAVGCGVDVGSLILVDPARRHPFGEPVGVDATSPALLPKMGVVIAAEHRVRLQTLRYTYPSSDFRTGLPVE